MQVALLVLAAASFTSAQNFGAEPSCAIPCLTSAISVAGCALTDEACQCGTGRAAIQTAVTPCLISACNAEDLGIAASVGLALCSAFSSTSGSATTTTTTAASTPSLTSPASTSSGSGSGSAATTSPATTSTPSTTSHSATPTSEGSSSTGTTKTSSSLLQASSTGAGNILQAGIGGAAGALVGILAIL